MGGGTPGVGRDGKLDPLCWDWVPVTTEERDIWFSKNLFWKILLPFSSTDNFENLLKKQKISRFFNLNYRPRLNISPPCNQKIPKDILKQGIYLVQIFIFGPNLLAFQNACKSKSQMDILTRGIHLGEGGPHFYRLFWSVMWRPTQECMVSALFPWLIWTLLRRFTFNVFFCCLRWVIVYMAQKYPLIVPLRKMRDLSVESS